jgi:hypothetical protein
MTSTEGVLMPNAAYPATAAHLPAGDGMVSDYFPLPGENPGGDWAAARTAAAFTVAVESGRLDRRPPAAGVSGPRSRQVPGSPPAGPTTVPGAWTASSGTARARVAVPMRTAEDHALLAAATEAGCSVLQASDITVETSARRHARAPQGFSHVLRTLASLPQPQ